VTNGMRAEASLDSRFARHGAWIAARPRKVLALFAVVLALAAVYGSSVAEHLPAAGLDVIGSESARVREQAAQRFGAGSADVLVLYENPEGSVHDAEFAARVLDSLDPVLDDPGVLGSTSLYETNEHKLASHDGRQTLVTLALTGDSAEKLGTYRRIEPLLREVEPPAEVRIGGLVPLSRTLQDVARQDAAAAETVALPIAALLALWFFRSLVAALLPVLVGGFALALSSALIRFGAEFTEITIFAMNVGAFLGLGLSLDYALLVVQRFREELARRESLSEAVAATMDTAGRSVFVSGLAVAISLAALTPVPMVVLRSMALGGVLVVASALLGALVALPALLAWIGRDIDRGSFGRAPEQIAPSPFWRRVGELSMRHPLAAIAACVLVLGTLASPALRMHRALPDSRALPPNAESRRVDEILSDPGRFDPGGASTFLILAETPGPVLAPDNLRALRDYIARVEAVPGIRGVRSAFAELDPALPPAELERRMAREPTSSLLRRLVDGDATLLLAEQPNPWRSPVSVELVEAVRAVPHPGLSIGVGGPSAATLDQVRALRRYGSVAVVLIALVNLLVLFAAFRSLVVPLKAVVMNVLSLGASYGVLVWIFQDGHLAGLLRFEPLDGVDPTVPLVMFAVLFGLSMDYEVFLLSRIREEWLRSGDNRESVIAGLARTGRIITSAALILIVVVGAFAAGEVLPVKQMGVGMVTAIALDVTLVRALLVPATMQLLGDWNWWLPRWLQTRAEPMPAEQTVA
jgi:RND superfamily putative drug exporter